MSVKRTGKVRTERTASGIIVKAEELVARQGKRPYKRWVEVKYVSTQGDN